jgi:hypothetical protein
MKVETPVPFVIEGVPEKDTRSEVTVYVELWMTGWDSRHSQKLEDECRRAGWHRG